MRGRGQRRHQVLAPFPCHPQAFINRLFSRITSIQASFELLERLQLVLQVGARVLRHTSVLAVWVLPPLLSIAWASS